MAERILLVEDEESIRELVRFNLEKEGFEVLETDDGEKAFELLKKQGADLAILDWMIPGVTGLELCRLIRRDPDWKMLPIIMLTAREDEIDKIVGLEMGADDYVTKPFSPRELMSRVKAVLRRANVKTESAVKAKEGKEKEEQLLGPIRIDETGYEAYLEGKKLDLAPKEYELLKMFVLHPGRAYSRQQILELIWGYDYFGDTRTVDVHIRHLRSKLAEINSDVAEAIETVRGIGYRMRDFTQS
ncbi:MAG: response regulator [Negativicutes bacterium]|nr:response regulator [Negativicutes bacterium]